MTGYSAGFVWLAILAIGIGTLLFRVSFILVFGRVDEIPPGVMRALRYVPPAILTALFIPRLFVLDGTLFVVGNDRLLAGAVGIMVAYYTKNMFATIIGGMLVLWLLTFVF